MDFLDKKMEKIGYTIQKEESFSMNYIKPKPENLYFGHAKQIEIVYDSNFSFDRHLIVSCHSVRNMTGDSADGFGYPMWLNLRELVIIFLKCIKLNIKWKLKSNERRK